MYVADTHAFLWFLSDDKRLGSKARKIFERCERGETTIVIPSIVLLESLFICEKKRLDFKFRKVIEKIRNAINYPVYPLDIEIIMLCQDLKQLSDPHDRIIVAIAKILNATLITKDKEIVRSKAVSTLW